MSKRHLIKTNCAYCDKELLRQPYRVRKGNCYCHGDCQLNYEYSTGKRNRFAITETSHIAMHKLIDKGEWSLQKPENHIKSNRELGHRNYGRTWIEEKMGWALVQLGIQFESQYPVKYGLDIMGRNKYYFPDFALPSDNILIECDGSYWHKSKSKDSLRQSRLEELGWQVLRFPEKDIRNNVMVCADKVLSTINCRCALAPVILER